MTHAVEAVSKTAFSELHARLALALVRNGTQGRRSPGTPRSLNDLCNYAVRHGKLGSIEPSNTKGATKSVRHRPPRTGPVGSVLPG